MLRNDFHGDIFLFKLERENVKRGHTKTQTPANRGGYLSRNSHLPRDTGVEQRLFVNKEKACAEHAPVVGTKRVHFLHFNA